MEVNILNETQEIALRMVSVFQVIAVTTTTYRLIYRVHIKRFWWDDFWASVALLLGSLYIPMLWLQWYAFSPAHNASLQIRINLTWILRMLFIPAVWTARISISTSILRVLPPNTIFSRLSVLITSTFCLMGLGIQAGKIWQCAHDSSWHHRQVPTCPSNGALNIVQIITDVLSSLLLVGFPLYVLWGVDLPSVERKLILSVFGCTIMITAVSVAHVYYSNTFHPNHTLYVLTGHLEIAISLLACNLLVVIPRIYRFFYPQGLEADIDTRFSTTLNRGVGNVTGPMRTLHGLGGTTQAFSESEPSAVVFTQVSTLPYSYSSQPSLSTPLPATNTSSQTSAHNKSWTRQI